MATQSPTLRNCLQFAADDARRSFALCIEQTVKAMQDAEGKSMTSARRNELTLAWRTLLNHQDALSRRYPDLLRGALEGESALAAKASDNLTEARFEHSRPFEDSDNEFGFEEDSLTLVDDTQLSQAIETSRLLQRVTAIIDPGLPLLDGLISSAMGLPNIAPGLNPVRPEVFVRTLRTVLSESGAEMTTVTVWFSHMAAPFSAELKALYEKLIKQLKDDGIQPVKYKVGMAPDAPSTAGAGGANGQAAADGGGEGGYGPGGYGPGGGGFGGPGGGQGFGNGQGGQGGPGGFSGGYARGGAEAFAAQQQGYGGPVEIIDLTDEQLNTELFRQFFSAPAQPTGAPRARRGLAPAYYQAVQQELAALSEEQDTEVLPDSGEEFRGLPAVERPRRYVDATMSLNSPVWGEYGRAKERALVRTQLKAEATEVDQVLGMEMVRQLVNEVARDKRLLGPMREAIVALEPALLRLAMIDPKFFTEAGHAGRRLIERVAQRSFRYNDEFAREFESFYDPVGASFNELNHLEDVADAKPFEEALAKLEEVWQEEDAQEAAPRNAMLEALRFAEERQALADQLAYEISQRTDLDLVPAVILDFLYGRWTLVMAQSRLKDTKNQLDPGGYGSLISDLLWSTKHDLTLNQPAKLIQIIPPMVRKINQGLDMLGEDQAQKQAFFETLERLHKPVLDLCRTRNRQEWAKDGFQDTRPAAPEAPATAEERVAKPAAQPWFGKKVLEEVGFEEPLAVSSEFANSAMLLPDSMFDSSSLPLDSGPAPLDSGSAPLEGLPGEGAPQREKTAEQTAEQIAEESAAERAKLTPAQMIKGLRTGVWVDLYSQQAWLRAQLVWASSKRTLFMFQSHGGRPHSMTRRSCERLIRTRHLRPVAMQEVVVRALEAIAAENEIALPVQSESMAQAIASQVMASDGEDRLDSGPLDTSPDGDALKLAPSG